jgi:hypothetical protein
LLIIIKTFERSMPSTAGKAAPERRSETRPDFDPSYPSLWMNARGPVMCARAPARFTVDKSPWAANVRAPNACSTLIDDRNPMYRSPKYHEMASDKHRRFAITFSPVSVD